MSFYLLSMCLNIKENWDYYNTCVVVVSEENNTQIGRPYVEC